MTPEPAKPARTGRWRALLARREGALALLLLLVVCGVSAINPAFATATNLRDLAVNAAPVLIVACGMMLVMVAGEIDISVGSLLGLLGALVGALASPAHAGWPLPATVAVVLLAGAAVGALNGVLVAIAGIPSIVVTLGMLTVLRAATEWLMAGEWITDLPASLRLLGTGTLAGVPICVCAAAAVTAGTALLTQHTAAGRRVFAVGSNPRAAALHGVSVVRTKLFVFTLTGTLTGLATYAPLVSLVSTMTVGVTPTAPILKA